MEKEQHTAHCTLHTANLQKSLNRTHWKILEWQVMNEKTNSSSMRIMHKPNTSFLIQERARMNQFLKISRSVVSWSFFELML